MFGTDTGFLQDYDVKEEYHQLALAGFSYHDVLAMLRRQLRRSGFTLRIRRVVSPSERRVT